MRGIKRILRTGVSLILSVAMIVSPLPLVQAGTGQVEAADITMPERLQSKLLLGHRLGPKSESFIGGANKKVSYENNEIDYVYFGKNNGEPLQYRVLSGMTKAYNASGDTGSKMLLHSRYIVKKGIYSTTPTTVNLWGSSYAKKWLNNDFLNNSSNFTNIEREALAGAYKKEEEDSINGVIHYDDPLNGEKVFLLSLHEAINTDYAFESLGFNESDGSRYRIYGNTTSDWWLRTRQYDSNCVWSVYSDGKIGKCDNPYYTYISVGYCPALLVDLEDVLFSYRINNEDRTFGNAYKLTLNDTNIGISLPYGAEIGSVGNVLTIPYNVTGSNKGNVNRLSVLVLDKEYKSSNFSKTNILEYKKLNIKSGDLTSGVGTVSLSKNYTDTSKYFVYVIAEDINGTHETDYACTPVRVTGFHQWNLTSSDQNVVVKCGIHSSETYTASVSINDKTYNGTKTEASIVKDKNFPPFITVGSIYYEGVAKTSYSSSTTPPTNAGSYMARATFTDSLGNQKTAVKYFEICRKALSDDMVILTDNLYEYDGKQKTPKIRVADGKTELKKDTDYTINDMSTLSATEADSYEIFIEGKGNYNGNAYVSWKIKNHSHSMKKTPAKAASETEAGNYEYYYCTKCGKYYSDAQGTKEIKKDSWIIKATGHKHNLVKNPAKAATETATGNKEYYYCSKCGKYYSDAQATKEIEKDSWVIKKLAHTHKLTKTAAKEPKGSTNGNTAYWYCSSCKKYFSDKSGKKEIKKNSWVILAKNKTFKHNGSKGKYKVTSQGSKNPTVTYIGSTESKPTSVTIPATVKYGAITYKVTEVGKGALKNKKKLTKITVGSNVKKIGTQAFMGCAKATKVTLGKNVTTIDAEAFSDCAAMTELTLPEKTTTIGKKFLNNCGKMKKLTVKSKSMTKKTVNDGAFTGTKNKSAFTVMVPKGLKSSYQKIFQNKGLGKKVTVKAASK